MPDNRLPTNQSQLDIVEKLDEIKDAIVQGGGGSSTLDGLNDVDIDDSTLADGQALVYDETNRVWVNGQGSSGGSGHTILDDDGTALAQEDDLQFKGVYTVDNSTDGVTEVNIYREMTKSQFNLLSADEKKGFIRVVDEPDIYSDGNFQPIIYSTEEREIGVWTDGKPLYQRTLVFVNPTKESSSGKYQYTCMYELGVIEFASLKTANAYDSVDQRWYEIPYMRQSSSENISAMEMVLPNGNYQFLVFFDSNQSYNLTTIIYTVQYTKTTDVAGSGSWTPQGVPTHKYSTEEQIIGTWIDGSTLYEKTYIGLNIEVINVNTWYDTGLSATGIDTFVDGKMIDVNKQAYPVNVAFMSSNTKIGISCGMANRTGVILTIQYTKSS